MTFAHAQKYLETIAVLTCDCSACSSKNLATAGLRILAPRSKSAATVLARPQVLLPGHRSWGVETLAQPL